MITFPAFACRPPFGRCSPVAQAKFGRVEDLSGSVRCYFWENCAYGVLFCWLRSPLNLQIFLPDPVPVAATPTAIVLVVVFPDPYSSVWLIVVSFAVGFWILHTTTYSIASSDNPYRVAKPVGGDYATSIHQKRDHGRSL